MITTRVLRELDEMVAASAVATDVWGDVALAPVNLLRAYAHSGNPVIGAYDGDYLVGTAFGFLANDPELHLHSHVACVLPSYQHAGVGFAMKQAQREWCRAQSIDWISWTFDPVVGRNAFFNLHKLGAVARQLLPNFYGAMDDDINRGQRTDRLEAWWSVHDVTRPAVERAVAMQEREPLVRELEAAFADGLVATDFDRERGYCFSRVES